MRKKRTLVPRTRESVNRQLDSTKEDGASMTMKGDFSINPKVKNVRYDRLRCYKAGKTVIRIWNMLDPENPGDALLNGRLSTLGMAGLGGMSISEPAYCVQYAGITKDTLGNWLARPEDAEPCSYIIARTKSSTYEGVNFWDEPYVKLYVMAKKARDSGAFGHGGAWDPKWNALMSGQNQALSVFRQKYFAVCSVYENGPSLDLTREHVEYRKSGKDVVKDVPRHGIPLGEAPDDPLIVMQLSISAGKKLLQLACMEKQDWEGSESENPSIMFKYGDPCGRFDPETGTVKGGVFFTIYHPEKVTIEKNSTFKGIINPTAVEYEAAVSRVYEGPNGKLTADLNKAQVDNILSKHLFFWKESSTDPEDSYLLHEPTIEERCVLIAKAFKPVPKLLEFSWMSNPEYLQFDSVVSILKNRTVVQVAKPDMDDDEEEDEEETAVEQASTGKKAKPETKPAGKKTAAQFLDEDNEDDEEFDEDELEDEEDEDDFDDEESEEDDEDGDDEEDDFDDEESEEDDEEEDDFDDDEESDAEESEDDFDDEPVVAKGGKGEKGGKSKSKPAEAVDEEDFDTPAATKGGKSKSKPAADPDEFDDEFDDDGGDEESGGKSDDFDDESDNSDIESQLNNHLSAAKAIARSSKRKSAPAAETKAKKAKKKSG